MGDHRVSIKIEFSMHGHTEKADWWYNWSDTIPEQAADWIVRQKAAAMEKWLAKQYKHREREYEIERAEEEQREREELARLKAKYDSPYRGTQELKGKI